MKFGWMVLACLTGCLVGIKMANEFKMAKAYEAQAEALERIADAAQAAVCLSGKIISYNNHRGSSYQCRAEERK